MVVLITSIVVMMSLVALSVIGALMSMSKLRPSKLWVWAIILLGCLGVGVYAFQAISQYKETQKREAKIAAEHAEQTKIAAKIAAEQAKAAAVQEDTRRSIMELVAQGRLSREDGRRILRVFSKELADSLVLSEELGIEIQRRQEKP